MGKYVKRKNQSHILRPPLMSWDIFAQSYHARLEELSKNRDLLALNKLKGKYCWHIEFETFDLEKKPYQAIVVTDATTKILWVNHGFLPMTGYTAKEAIGRKPKFLQGDKTSDDAKARIRNALDNKEPVSTSLINYRKDGDEYICEVSIYPLFTKENKLTHFIALEREVA